MGIHLDNEAWMNRISDSAANLDEVVADFITSQDAWISTVVAKTAANLGISVNQYQDVDEIKTLAYWEIWKAFRQVRNQEITKDDSLFGILNYRIKIAAWSWVAGGRSRTTFSGLVTKRRKYRHLRTVERKLTAQLGRRPTSQEILQAANSEGKTTYMSSDFTNHDSLMSTVADEDLPAASVPGPSVDTLDIQRAAWMVIEQASKLGPAFGRLARHYWIPVTVDVAAGDMLDYTVKDAAEILPTMSMSRVKKIWKIVRYEIPETVFSDLGLYTSRRSVSGRDEQAALF